jgi:hypothetical protein
MSEGNGESPCPNAKLKDGSSTCEVRQRKDGGVSLERVCVPVVVDVGE